MKLRSFYLRFFGTVALFALVMMTHTACTVEKDIDTIRKEARLKVPCSVTFNLNGGTGTTPVQPKVRANSPITLPANTGFFRDGYIFSGWNTKKDGTKTNYDAGDSYTVTDTVTFYAQWDAIDITINSITIATDDGEIKDGIIEGVIGGEIWFYAELEMEPEDAGDFAYAVTWKVSGGNGDSWIENGILSIDEDETVSPTAFYADTWLTVTATSMIDSQKSATVQVKMVNGTVVVPTNPTLTVEVVPVGAATLRLRRGNSAFMSGAKVPAGTSVTITPTANTGYTFSSITGAGLSGAGPWTFTMPNEDTEVTIQFALIEQVIEPDPDPTLTFTVTPGTATVRVYKGTSSVTSVTSGSSVKAGTDLTMYYSQTTAQINAYELDFIESVPDIDFDPESGSSSSDRWMFEMPNEDTEITIEFKSRTGEEFPTLSWTVTGGTVAVSGVSGAPFSSPASVPPNAQIYVLATPTLGATATVPQIAGLNPAPTGAGVLGSPWTFAMPATNASFTVTFSGTVTNPTAVTGVTLNQTALNLTVGGTAALTATVQPETATNKAVTWSTSAAGVATVSTTGTVTAVATGTATISVTTTDGNFTVHCIVTVTGGSPVTEDPTLSWMVTGGTVAVTAGGAAITSGATHPTGTQISIIATPNTMGATPNIAGVTGVTGAGTAASPWTFIMPESDVSITVSFTTPETADYLSEDFNTGLCSFFDKFDGTGTNVNANGLDRDKWGFDNGGGGFGNGEAQYYDGDNNAIVRDGILSLVLEKKRTGNNDYTSAKVWTSTGAGQPFSQQYGRFEAKIRMVSHGTDSNWSAANWQGFYPGFWMMPTTSAYGIWPRSGEIDIMEMKGRIGNQASSTIHAMNRDGNAAGGSMYRGTDHGFDEGDITTWHVYSIIWSPTGMKMLIDGKMFREILFSSLNLTWYSDSSPQQGPFNKPFYLIINFAVGGQFDSWRMPEDVALPASLDIDWVRCYTLENDPWGTPQSFMGTKRDFAAW